MGFLDLQEPVYEFEFESRFVPRAEKYPRDEPPFNWYYQDQMDKKELNEHVMKDYLKELSPFESPRPEPAKYPLVDIDRALKPRWYRYELTDKRKRRLQYSIIPFKHVDRNDRLKTFVQNLPYQQK